MTDSLKTDHPRKTATTGFTYAYVETSDVRAWPRSHEYYANPTHDPMTIR